MTYKLVTKLNNTHSRASRRGSGNISPKTKKIRQKQNFSGSDNELRILVQNRNLSDSDNELFGQDKVSLVQSEDLLLVFILI